MHAQKQADRVQDDIVRLERFVERFRAKKDKAKQAQAKITQIERLKKERAESTEEIALLTRKRRTLGFEFLKPARSGRTVVEVEGLEPPHRRARADPRRVVRDRARRARRARRAERLRQDDAARDAARPPRRGDGEDPARARRRAGVLLAAGDGARHARLGAPVRADDDGAEPAGRAVAARPLPLLRLGRAREAGVGAVGRRAAAARARGDGRVGCELPRARRADEPSRPREPRGARGGARRVPGHACCSSRTTARCSTRSPSGRSRSRTASCTPTTAAGPRCSAGARSAPRGVRAEAGEAGEAEADEAEAGGEARAKPRPSELERLEAEIAAQEAEVARLEAKLAEDWSDVDVLAAHKRSRDALTALLERWELLFEQAQA